MRTDILEIQRNCLDFLLEWQFEHNEFYFVPRKQNRHHKLDMGMYFRGTDDYMIITFWDKSDVRNGMYMINWKCDSKGRSSIVLSCQNDKNKNRVFYIKEIISIIEAQGKIFEEKNNQWIYRYPSDKYYLDTLQNFILVEKPLIDNYLRLKPESKIPLADKTVNDKLEKALFGYKGYIKSIQRTKKTSSVKVKASDYIMTFQHNELSNVMVEYLKKNGYYNVKAEDNYVDISCRDLSGKKIFFELKTARTVKAAIREAIGQLIEYNHYPDSNRADKLIIITSLEPTKDDIKYLTGLRNIYHIPVYYQQFIMDTERLSQEY